MYTFLIQYFTFSVVFHPSIQDNWEFRGSWYILCAVIVLIAAWTNIYNFYWITGSYLSAGVFSSTCMIYVYMGVVQNEWDRNELLFTNSEHLELHLCTDLKQAEMNVKFILQVFNMCSLTFVPLVHAILKFHLILCNTGTSTCLAAFVDLHGFWHGCCVFVVFDIPPDKEFHVYQILRLWWPRYRALLPYPTPGSCSSRSLLTPKCQCGRLYPAGKVINQLIPPWNGVQPHLQHVPSVLWWVMQRKIYNKP